MSIGERDQPMACTGERTLGGGSELYTGTKVCGFRTMEDGQERFDRLGVRDLHIEEPDALGLGLNLRR